MHGVVPSKNSSPCVASFRFRLRDAVPSYENDRRGKPGRGKSTNRLGLRSKISAVRLVARGNLSVQSTLNQIQGKVNATLGSWPGLRSRACVCRSCAGANRGNWRQDRGDQRSVEPPPTIRTSLTLPQHRKQVIRRRQRRRRVRRAEFIGDACRAGDCPQGAEAGGGLDRRHLGFHRQGVLALRTTSSTPAGRRARRRAARQRPTRSARSCMPIRDNEQRAISLGYRASLQDSSQGLIFVVVVMVFRRGIMGELGPLLHRISKSSQRAEAFPPARP